MSFFYQKSKTRDYILIIVGTALMAIAVTSIYEPIKLVTGGFSGLGIVLKEITKKWTPGGIPLWLTNAVLNVPLFLFGIKIKGMHFLKKSLCGTVALSFFLYVIPPLPLMHGDVVLATLFGGVIMGVGIGMVFSGQGTTGGTDMVAALVQHRLKHYSIAQIMQFIDGAVVLLGVYVFGINKALYAIIAIFVTSKVTDALIEGMKFAKVAFIITEHYQEVSDKVISEIKRGMTGISAQGMYSNDSKTMLFCVVSKKEIVQLKEIISNIDPKAFVIVTDAREVLGEGFIEYTKQGKKGP